MKCPECNTFLKVIDAEIAMDLGEVLICELCFDCYLWVKDDNGGLSLEKNEQIKEFFEESVLGQGRSFVDMVALLEFHPIDIKECD